MHSTLLLSPLHAHPDKTKQCLSLSPPLCVRVGAVKQGQRGRIWGGYESLPWTWHVGNWLIIMKDVSVCVFFLNDKDLRETRTAQNLILRHTGKQILDWVKGILRSFPWCYFSFSPRLLLPSSCVQSWANESLSSWLIKDVRVTARTCHSSKQSIGDGVSECSSKYANLRWHVAWFSLWYPCVLMWASWNPHVGWHGGRVCVCVCEFWVSLFVFRDRLTVLSQNRWVDCKLEKSGAAILLSNLSGNPQHRTFTG